MTRDAQDFSTRGRRPRPDLVGVVLVLFGLGLLSGVVWSWRSTRTSRTAVTGELKRARGAAQDLDRAAARARKGGIGERVARAALVGRVPPRRFLAEITKVLPDGVVLDSFGASYGTELEVRLEFVARNAEAYDAFLRRLRSSPAIIVRGAGSERRFGAMKGSVVLGWRDEELPR